MPDLFVAEARGQWAGLFVEMKYGKNKPTNQQAKILSHLESVGYKTAVCYEFDEFRTTILNYLHE